MSRTKNSFYNAITAVLLTLVNGLLGIIVTHLIINRYGSDFNGLNSTANQIINVLLILEGGFTIASNVALFDPISKGDFSTSNAILKATRLKFRKIGILFILIGTAVSFVYCLIAKTELAREFVFTVIFMAVVPQAVNLFFSTTYRVLLQTQQKEYIINAFTALTIGLGHIVNIVIIQFHCQMWMIRFVTMCFALLNCFLIAIYTKKKNAFLDFSCEPKPQLIKGTGDVMAMKITGVIYNSWPIVFLSISPSGGTKLASVYAVYNNVFVMLKALLHGIIDAPRLGFGQMLTEKKREEVWVVFKDYEFIAVFFTFIAMTTACGLILPFIFLYTKGVTDINYYDVQIAVMMVLIGSLEMLHIPSGHLINMSGNFKVSKTFQIIACITLIVTMTLFGYFNGVYGMLQSLLFVSVLLFILEVGYIHTRFFEKKLPVFIRLVLPYLLFGAGISFLEMYFYRSNSGVLKFIAYGFIYFVVNIVLALIIGFIFDKSEVKNMLSRGKGLLKRIR